MLRILLPAPGADERLNGRDNLQRKAHTFAAGINNCQFGKKLGELMTIARSVGACLLDP
jgi:hypothetical protein